MVVHSFNSMAGQAEAPGLQWVQGNPGLCSKLKASQATWWEPSQK